MKSAIDTFWSIMEFAVPLALALAYEARAHKLPPRGARSRSGARSASAPASW